MALDRGLAGVEAGRPLARLALLSGQLLKHGDDPFLHVLLGDAERGQRPGTDAILLGEYPEQDLGLTLLRET